MSVTRHQDILNRIEASFKMSTRCTRCFGFSLKIARQWLTDTQTVWGKCSNWKIIAKKESCVERTACGHVTPKPALLWHVLQTGLILSCWNLEDLEIIFQNNATCFFSRICLWKSAVGKNWYVYSSEKVTYMFGYSLKNYLPHDRYGIKSEYIYIYIFLS